MTRTQRDQLKEKLQWGTMLTSLAVGLTVLGLVPKCSEVQTTKAAQSQHDMIRKEVEALRIEIKDDVRRIIESNANVLEYQRDMFKEMKDLIKHGTR